MFRNKVCVSFIYPICSFSLCFLFLGLFFVGFFLFGWVFFLFFVGFFFGGGHFEKAPGAGVHPTNFPVNITDSYSIGCYSAFIIRHVLLKKAVKYTYFVGADIHLGVGSLNGRYLSAGGHFASTLGWYDRYNTHHSFDIKFKSFRIYAVLLQGHKCQSKSLALQ